MNALAWNCLGLGSLGKIQFLQEVTRSEKPSFVFLCETISRYEKMEKLCSCEPVKFSHSPIDISVYGAGSKSWRLTGIYGEPARTRRFKMWEFLKNLSRDANLPWCVMGDINNVTSQTSKKGGPPYPNHLIEGFNDCLHEANLHDLDIIGHQFTWEKGRNTDHWVEIRLDRVLANTHWLDVFDMDKVYNLQGYPSDHSPLLLCPEMQLRRNKRRPFRFENAWLTEPMCSQIIKDCWEEEEDNTILQRLSKCAESLNVWGKEITGSFSSRIKDCKAKLKLLRGKRDAWSVAEFENTRQQLFLVLDQKEIF
ncbi:uncharacterized protein LOC141665210 [Apium graveolens]|uniref:uncharacterized protein LOC141665210 n=1 Tax=Apium graveolens TaxID=4045 RepID=UPI003D7C13F4